MKKFLSVRYVLSALLFLSIVWASIATYYKVKHWGFSFDPKLSSNVWIVDAHISFKPTGAPISISLSVPKIRNEYKILSEDIVAKGYDFAKDEQNNRYKLTAEGKKGKQDIYYRVMLYDNEESKGKFWEEKPEKVVAPVFENEQQQAMVEDIWRKTDDVEGDTKAQKLIKLLNQYPLDSAVDAFLPVKKSQKIMAENIIFLLSARDIPARVVRGIKLSEEKRSTSADLMVEVYVGSKWMVYDIETGKSGLPENFIIFQRGGNSLLDVSGGKDSKVKFSVTRSAISSFKMAESRAKYEKSKLFEYSIYDLPSLEQNTLKWLMIFPLGILLIVLTRNVIGIKTMGTFTPMLIAMSLVKTGFVSGLLCFGLLIGLGLIIRTMLTRLNLLLVPRISAVVIFVILIMQVLTVLGYKYDLYIASSAIFFPIIITAWVIERASITWEEDGPKNAIKEIVNSLFVAIFTYAVISNEYTQHIMFAFNEWNIVILFIVMLLGTYTGYRLTELKRFAPLVKDL